MPRAYDEIEGSICSIIRGIRSRRDERLREKSGHEARSHCGIEISGWSFSLLLSVSRYTKWEGGVEEQWRVDSTNQVQVARHPTQVE
jgi:hypothetical protein